MVGLRVIQLFLVTIFFAVAGFLPTMNWESDKLYWDQEWQTSQLVIESLVPQGDDGNLTLVDLEERLLTLILDIDVSNRPWLHWLLYKAHQVIDADSR